LDWGAIEKDISRETGTVFRATQAHSLGGGCINEAACLEGDGRRFFVKLNTPQRLAMFAAETEGLEEMLSSGSIRVPQPVCYGSDEAHSWLVLEYIEFGPADQTTSAQLGEQLAAMHRCTIEHFGWKRDNTIGATPQVNSPEKSWVDFLREHRLRYQLELAEANGASSRLLDRGLLLLEALPAFFETYNPLPSLLHGDLWGGNWGADNAGQPVIFDPAVYYGDREADLAMTELFGGFDDRFYQSYRHAWAIDPGYSSRKVLYNLYHVLNHFNLFGGSYAGQALGMVDTPRCLHKSDSTGAIQPVVHIAQPTGGWCMRI
jgi:fructosamine-3-kinase